MNAASAEQGLQEARMRIARMHVAKTNELHVVWTELSDIVMTALRVDRIGVWILVDDGISARCRFLSQRSTQDLYQGTILRAKDFPNYFRAVEGNRAVVADDALASPLTSELRKAYLEPLGIVSMLDAPLYREGKVVGIVCHEHIGQPRKWSEAECDFAMAVADNIARLYQEHLLLTAQSTLREFESHVAELNRMEAIGRLAAGVAHDFRNVLTSVMGFAELALRTPGLPPDADRLIRQSIKAAERGQQLAKEITNFGKEETVAPRVLDAREVIYSLAPMFRVLSSSRIECHFDLHSPVSRVFMDPLQLERALLNLVLNARDAMQHGGKLTITVADTQIQHEGELNKYVAITVADTGQGMDDATRQQILKPFFTTKGESGTGLGLAIVDQIVLRAGGFIRFESAVGSGTKAIIYLPRIASATATDLPDRSFAAQAPDVVSTPTTH